MPGSSWPMLSTGLFYSIDIGPIHFVTLNTEVFFSQKEQLDSQLKWLKEDLQKANSRRESHPWIIVLGHRPMYCSLTNNSQLPSNDKKEDDECLIVRTKLENILFEEGVDLYIAGHQHNYERSWPVYKGTAFHRNYINPKAPIHIVNGAMGYQYIVDDFKGLQPAWSAVRLCNKEKELYGKLEVLNSSHLAWEVYAAENNALEDSILIVQHQHGSFGKSGNHKLIFSLLPDLKTTSHFKILGKVLSVACL